LFTFIFAYAALAEPTPWQAKFNAYVKGLPQDATAFLERVDGCDHFGGEEPYDEQRRKEILEAVTKLKCDSVDKDRDALLKKYKKQTQIVNKIKNFPAALN
jgi:hypothetical protein